MTAEINAAAFPAESQSEMLNRSACLTHGSVASFATSALGPTIGFRSAVVGADLGQGLARPATLATAPVPGGSALSTRRI